MSVENAEQCYSTVQRNRAVRACFPKGPEGPSQHEETHEEADPLSGRFQDLRLSSTPKIMMRNPVKLGRKDADGLLSNHHLIFQS